MLKNTKHVEYLLVEDNPNDAELFVRALKKIVNTNNLLVLEDGEEALNFLFKKDKYLNLTDSTVLKAIFLDLKLPKLNGLEVLKEIKADNDLMKIPVIVFTSSKEIFDIKSAYSLGANSYVVKPMDYESFTKTIANIAKYWLLMNETVDQ